MRIAKQCLEFKGFSCNNKDCKNMKCPLNPNLFGPDNSELYLLRKKFDDEIRPLKRRIEELQKEFDREYKKIKKD